MAGIFGIVGESNCTDELILGASYLQHGAQQYCGVAVYDGDKLIDKTHKGKMKEPNNERSFNGLRGHAGIASLASDRQPISELSKFGAFLFAFDGNVINYLSLP